MPQFRRIVVDFSRHLFKKQSHTHIEKPRPAKKDFFLTFLGRGMFFYQQIKRGVQTGFRLVAARSNNRSVRTARGKKQKGTPSEISRCTISLRISCNLLNVRVLLYRSLLWQGWIGHAVRTPLESQLQSFLYRFLAFSVVHFTFGSFFLLVPNLEQGQELFSSCHYSFKLVSRHLHSGKNVSVKCYFVNKIIFKKARTTFVNTHRC